jgi:hypothetical protein
MEELPQTDKECFIKQMESEVRLALSRVIDAVNAAPDGQWISASEKPVRDVIDELKRRAYETAIQMRVDSKESTFSPSEGSVGPGVVPSGSQGKPQRIKRQRSH